MTGKIFVSDFLKRARRRLKLPKRVRIFDTTLRDGEQTPGVAFTIEEKITLARQLDKLGVDVIEAGFPVASKGEKEAVRRIAKEGLSSEICGLSRVLKPDIDACLDCDVDLVHTFVSTSDIQIKHTIKKSKKEVLQMAVDAVSYIKDHGRRCLFSAMDATRTDLDYLIKINKAAEEAGADIVNIPDTVGVMIPLAMRDLIGRVYENVKVPIDVHCHNDFGLAVPNSLAAVEAGADGVQVAVNGLGERAGNASLEEVVMSLTAIYGVKTNIRAQYLVETSRLVERLAGVRIPPNYPIVGENAFSHESGIHTHGVVSDARTFEPGFMTPEMVGHHRRLVAGKQAGIHGVGKMLRDMGIKVTKSQLKEITKRVKDLGDKKKLVTDTDLRALAESIIGTLPKEEEVVKLKEVTVTTGSTVTPTASVRLTVHGEERIGSGTGVGPVDAAINALRNVMDEISELRLKEYHLDAITGGSDALAGVTVKLEDEKNNLYIARGVREDVVIASVEAMVNGINRYFAQRR